MHFVNIMHYNRPLIRITAYWFMQLNYKCIFSCYTIKIIHALECSCSFRIVILAWVENFNYGLWDRSVLELTATSQYELLLQSVAVYWLVNIGVETSWIWRSSVETCSSKQRTVQSKTSDVQFWFYKWKI